MKNVIFLFSITLVVFFMSSNISAAELSETQQKAYAEISKFLTEEGFSYSIDNEDATLNFKKEGVLHWIYVSKDGSVYTINRGGFKIGGDDGYESGKSLYAANAVNKDLSVVKAYCTDSSARVSYEVQARTIEDFKYVFYKAISALSSARDKFIEAYKDAPTL